MFERVLAGTGLVLTAAGVYSPVAGIIGACFAFAVMLRKPSG